MHSWSKAALAAAAAALSFVAPLGSVAAASASAPATALQANWQQVVSNSPALRHATISAYAYDLTTNTPLAEIDPTNLQIPASVTKLFTSVAALATLGPDFTYRTRVEASPAVLQGKPGPIYLVGGGDPWLEANGTHGLETLAAEVAKKIPQATSVIGVASLYTPPGTAPGWSLHELQDAYAGDATALTAERSEIEVVVTAGLRAGDPARVQLHFNGDVHDSGYFRIQNSARTVASRGSGAKIGRLAGTNTLVVSGTLSPGQLSAKILSVHDPALFAASLFQQALSQRGVHFTAPAATGLLPSGSALVAVQQSPPLRKLLVTQNRFSVNLMADNLHRMLGVASGGNGTPAAARAAMAAFMQHSGLAPQLQIDGSGLSPLNERSAAEVVALLSYAAKQPWFGVFKQSLMEAGNRNSKVCGVLCGHFVNTPARNRVWLKTGNLDNQWNYAGYATAANGDTIAFAILIEGPSTKTLDGYGPSLSPIDQMTVDLARWPAEPAADPPAATPAQADPAVVTLVQGLLQTAPGAVTGGAVVDLRSGRIVWQQNGDKLIRTNWTPRLPLLYASLQNGPAAFGPVTVRANGTVRNGVLDGSLLLDGNLDPTLNPSDLQLLAQQVRRAGITQVSGALTYRQDASQGGVAAWPNGSVNDAVGQWWLPPVTRLALSGDQVQLTLRAAAAGAPVQVTIAPSDAPISIENRLTAVAQGQRASAAAQWQRGTDTYVLAGSVPVGRPVTIDIAPPDAGLVAAQEFKDALKAAGVQVRGAAQGSTAVGTGAVVASLSGPRIASLAPALLANASTGVAAQLNRLLGSAAAADLAAAVGPVDVIPDPTGTSMGDYMTPDSVAQLLAKAWSAPVQRPLVDALGRFAPWRVVGPESEAVVGYLQGPDGTPYAVAFLQSGLPWSGTWAPQISPGNLGSGAGNYAR